MYNEIQYVVYYNASIHIMYLAYGIHIVANYYIYISEYLI